MIYNMKTTGICGIRYCVVLAFAIVASVAAAVVSCVPAEGDVAGDYTICPEPLVAYEGKWDIGAEEGLPGVAWIATQGFAFDSIPAASVVRQLFPGSEVAAVASADGGYAWLKCSATQASDNSLLYSAEPSVWRVKARVDGRQRVVGIAFAPRVGSGGDISWGTLSRTGVLTLVLHATSYTVDDGSAAPLAMKLVFTAKRKK